MITDTLNLRDLNEVGYLALVSALVLLGGLLGGLANFYVLDRNERNVNAEHSGLIRELLIGSSS